MAFPLKAYDRLHNLATRWNVTHDDIYYAVENDLLRACVWLPLRYVERGCIHDGKFKYERHEHKEGFIALRPEDFRMISSTGRTKLRIFRSVKEEGHILRLAYEPPQPAILVRISDIIVLNCDIAKFEQTYNITNGGLLSFPLCNGIDGTLQFSNDYRHVTLGGEQYHLGDVQARVIERLHDAARSRQPWVHGKTLIDEAGSRAVRLRDVFKHKVDWRKLITSNGRGYYRLNVPLEQFSGEPPTLAAYCKPSEKNQARSSNTAR